RGNDFLASRLWIFREQCRGRDQDAGQAVAALSGLLVQERLLQRMQGAVVRQSFDGGDGTASDGGDLACAGMLGLAVDQHHAGAALLGTAAEFAAAQAKLVAQNRQQWRRAVALGGNGTAVDDKLDDFAHARPTYQDLLLDLDAFGVDETRPVLDLV